MHCGVVLPWRLLINALLLQDGAVTMFPWLKTKQQAFILFLAVCLSVAVSIFSILVLLWR